MLNVRRSQDRGYFKNEWLESFHSFSFGSYHDSSHMNFGPLRVINQDVIQPGSGFDFHGHRDMEIFTYILQGELEHQDSMGHREKIRQGEVQIMSAGRGILHSEFNASKTERVELLQIWVQPETFGLTPRYEQKKFEEQEKLDQLKLIISPDAEGNSLKIFQKTWVWASLLQKSSKLEFTLNQGKKAWLHIGSGQMKINGEFYGKGDAVSMAEGRLHLEGVAPVSDFVILEMGE